MAILNPTATLSAAIALVGALAVPAASATFESHTYANDAGSRTYKVYVPDGAPPAAGWPLLVDLHGCSSYADEESRWSRFNELADAHRFIAAYPEQSADANGGRCWNWFHPDHQSRGAGEPSIIAGITETVIAGHPVDPRRVWIAGISAGAGMSVVMAVTYPDLYAAAMVYAGCEYKGTTCFAALAAVPPEIAGKLAYDAMGADARVVPVIVIQGDLDPLVPFPNADLIVQQFLAADDWADDGDNDGSIPRMRSGTRSGVSPGGRAFDVDTYTDRTGCLLAERWLIHGMGHMWSGAEPNGTPRDMLLTDPLGPDVSSEVIRFFFSHPMPESGVACFQSASGGS